MFSSDPIVYCDPRIWRSGYRYARCNDGRAVALYVTRADATKANESRALTIARLALA